MELLDEIKGSLKDVVFEFKVERNFFRIITKEIEKNYENTIKPILDMADFYEIWPIDMRSDAVPKDQVTGPTGQTKWEMSIEFPDNNDYLCFKTADYSIVMKLTEVLKNKSNCDVDGMSI
jgi:hypothetical protein